MHNFIVPKMGQGDTEVEIIKILINIGDHIKEGDSLFEVESEKVNTVLESNVTGIVKEILINEGDIIKAGATLARIELV